MNNDQSIFFVRAKKITYVSNISLLISKSNARYNRIVIIKVPTASLFATESSQAGPICLLVVLLSLYLFFRVLVAVGLNLRVLGRPVTNINSIDEHGTDSFE